MRQRTPWSIERLQRAQPVLWLIAVMFFGVGDVVTTSIGLGMDGVHEAGPVTSAFIEQYGQLSMVAVKVGILGGCYVLWRLAPRPHRAGVPFGLAILGVAVVWWNLFVKLVAVQL